jgi:hypothetical protein
MWSTLHGCAHAVLFLCVIYLRRSRATRSAGTASSVTAVISCCPALSQETPLGSNTTTLNLRQCEILHADTVVIVTDLNIQNSCQEIHSNVMLTAHAYAVEPAALIIMRTWLLITLLCAEPCLAALRQANWDYQCATQAASKSYPQPITGAELFISMAGTEELENVGASFGGAKHILNSSTGIRTEPYASCQLAALQTA